MRIGLAGTGRIGAFHARTLTTIDGVDDLVVADLDTTLVVEEDPVALEGKSVRFQENHHRLVASLMAGLLQLTSRTELMLM